MTIDRASVEEGARLAAEATPGEWAISEKRWITRVGLSIRDLESDHGRLAAWLEEADAAFVAHWNPEFAAEVAREIQRLWRVEDAAREVRRALDATNEPDIERGYAKAEAILDAALADPAAEE